MWFLFLNARYTSATTIRELGKNEVFSQVLEGIRHAWYNIARLGAEREDLGFYPYWGGGSGAWGFTGSLFPGEFKT